MFCPECRCEYRTGFTTCADCRVPLVPELPAVERAAVVDEEASEPVLLCSAGSQLDAELVRSLLESAGIRSMVGGALLTQQYEALTVSVRRSDLAQARELLDAWQLPTELSPADPPAGRGDEASAVEQGGL